MKITTLILDVHRTLVDASGFPRDWIWRLMEKAGAAINFEEYYSRYDMLVKQLFDWPAIHPARTIRDIHRERLAIFYREYGVKRNIEKDLEFLWACMGESHIYPEVPEVLRALKEKYRLALASNADNDDPLIQILMKNNFQFDAIVTSEAIQCYKPNSRFFQHVLEKLEVDRENALVIGDSLPADIQGAFNAGIKSVWLNRAGNAPGNQYPKSDYTIKNLKELFLILD